MRHGLGCILDRREIIAGDLRLRHVARLVGSDPTHAPVRDWTANIDAIQNQGQTNACVAFALSTALYLAGRNLRAAIPRPSIRHMYAVGHWLDQPGTPISPGGRSIRRTIRAAEIHGVTTEKRWGWDEAKATEPFPLDLDVASTESRVTGYYGVGGGDLPTQLRVAISAGHVPIVAMNVRESFGDYAGGILDNRGASLGWHAMAVVGYSPGTFVLCNSWGASWGQNGLALVPDDVLRGEDTADAVVVTAAPRGVQ